MNVFERYKPVTMKSLIVMILIFFNPFARVFSQEVLKTNLRVKLVNNIEFPEKLDCEFKMNNKRDTITWYNIDHSIFKTISLTTLEETFNLHVWKIDTYETTYGEKVQLNYEESELYGIRMIDTKGVETLYIKSNDKKEYPRASK